MRKRKRSLKEVYYSSFLILIVIPILLVFGVAIGVLNVIMRDSEISNVQNIQASIADMLKTEIRDVSLQLSHFVYNNDGEFMRMAASTDTDEVAEKYNYMEKLEQAFATAVAPKQDILSMKFYMKSGRSTYLKDELNRLPEEIRATNWYQQALQNKNTVSIGTYDTSTGQLTYSRQGQWEFILVAALSPDSIVDRSEKIEMTAVFYRSDIGKLIQKYQREAGTGMTVLVDENNEIMYQGHKGEQSAWYLDQADHLEPGTFQKKIWPCEENQKKQLDYTYVISEIAPYGWKIVNMIPTREMTKQLDQVVMILFGVIMGLFLLFYLFSRFFLRNILAPVHDVVEGMSQVQEGNLTVHLDPEGQYEIRQMIHSFNRMVRMLNTLIAENNQVQKKKHEAEIKALQSQINPHFLVNTLNSIRFVAQMSKFEGIQKMAEALIKIVSCSFRSNISFYTLKEEMDVLDSYIYLMRIRYAEGFDVEYHLEEESLKAKVPRLILQPLVENAIVHGFTGEEFGHIRISSELAEHKVRIRIWDNGQGMKQEQIDRILNQTVERKDDNTSIGMENVISRLRLNFRENCGIDIESKENQYTCIRLEIPFMTDEGEQ